MEKKITAEQMHQLLKKEVFMDADLDKVATMSEDERRRFMMAEADALLSQRDYGDSLEWFIYKFLNDERERRMDNPLYEEESALADWYEELAEFGFDLYFHHPLDLNVIEPGMAIHPAEPEKDFTIENEKLVKWLRETPYRHVAALIARIVIEREYARVVGRFDAVQDYYAENCNSNNVNVKELAECEAYISNVLESIETVRAHQQRGRELGLNDEEMRVVDALWGWMPHDYEEPYPDAAREIYQAAEASMPAPTVIRSRNGFALFKQPLMKKMEDILKKYDLDIDLTDEYNITMGYLTEWLFAKYMGDAIKYDNPLDGYQDF